MANRFCGVQIPWDIWTCFASYLYSTERSWIIKVILTTDPGDEKIFRQNDSYTLYIFKYSYNVILNMVLHTWFIISSTQWYSSKSTKASIGASLSPVSFRLVSSHSFPLLPWWSSSREILETLDLGGNREAKSWAKCRHLTEIINERQIGLQMVIFICDKCSLFIYCLVNVSQEIFY